MPLRGAEVPQFGFLNGLPEIDWGHPIMQKASYVWTPFGVCVRGGKTFAPGATLSRRVGALGAGKDFNGSSNTEVLPAIAGVVSPYVSRMAWVQSDSSAVSTQTILGGGNNGFGLRLNSSGIIDCVVTGASVVGNTTTSVYASGEAMSVAATYVSNTASARLYKNGVNKANAAPAAAPISAASPVVGSNGNSAQYFDGIIYLGIAWDGIVLPDAAIRWLHENIDEIIAFPSDEQFWVGAGGGNSLTHSGSGGMTIAGVAALLRKMSAQSSGGILISGASANAAKSSSIGQGGIVISGSSPVIAKSSNVGSGSVTYSGSGPVSRRISVTPSGGLNASGSANVSFGANSISHVASGGLALLGAAVSAFLTPVMSFVASGGISLGGAATVSTVGGLVQPALARFWPIMMAPFARMGMR